MSGQLPACLHKTNPSCLQDGVAVCRLLARSLPVIHRLEHLLRFIVGARLNQAARLVDRLCQVRARVLREGPKRGFCSDQSR